MGGGGMGGMGGMGGGGRPGFSAFDSDDDMNGMPGGMGGLFGGIGGGGPQTSRRGPQRRGSGRVPSASRPKESLPSEILKPLHVKLEDLLLGTTKKVRSFRVLEYLGNEANLSYQQLKITRKLADGSPAERIVEVRLILLSMDVVR